MSSAQLSSLAPPNSGLPQQLTTLKNTLANNLPTTPRIDVFNAVQSIYSQLVGNLNVNVFTAIYYTQQALNQGFLLYRISGASGSQIAYALAYVNSAIQYARTTNREFLIQMALDMETIISIKYGVTLQQVDNDLGPVFAYGSSIGALNVTTLGVIQFTLVLQLNIGTTYSSAIASIVSYSKQILQRAYGYSPADLPNGVAAMLVVDGYYTWGFGAELLTGVPGEQGEAGYPPLQNPTILNELGALGGLYGGFIGGGLNSYLNGKGSAAGASNGAIIEGNNGFVIGDPLYFTKAFFQSLGGNFGNFENPSEPNALFVGGFAVLIGKLKGLLQGLLSGNPNNAYSYGATTAYNYYYIAEGKVFKGQDPFSIILSLLLS